MSDKHTPDVIWATPSLGIAGGGFWEQNGPRHELSRRYLLATPAREAAPAMLEALKAICEMQARCYGNGSLTHMRLFDLCETARAAIAAATGKAAS